MSVAAKVRADLEPRRAEMIALLQKLVEIESPSDDRPGLDRFAATLTDLFAPFGPIEPVPGERGANLLLRVDGAEQSPHAVALCRYDHGVAEGTLERIRSRRRRRWRARTGLFRHEGRIVCAATSRSGGEAAASSATCACCSPVTKEVGAHVTRA